MIKTFADKATQKLFVQGKTKSLPSDLSRRAIRRLEYIHLATSLNDLKVPPSNRLHALKEDSEGNIQFQSMINGESVSDSLRVTHTMSKLQITIKEQYHVYTKHHKTRNFPDISR